MALKRLNKEVALFGENAEVPPGLSAGPASSSNLYLWSASITGPEKTPYEGYSFELRIEFPPDYPFKPPKLGFVTPIYHVNISEQGVACLPVLKENWSPAVNTVQVLSSVRQLLAKPNTDDPVRADVASLYINNRTEHDKKARAHAKQHAKSTSRRR